MTMFGSQWLANAGSTYEIAHSCRFNDNDSAFTAWTPGGVGDSTKIFTFSMWFKRGNLVTSDLFSAGLTNNDSNYTELYFDATDHLYFRNRVAITFQLNFATTAVYRDPSAWMHIHLACDTTEALATNGVKITVNGVRVTSFSSSTYTQNSDVWFSKANLHRIGRAANDTGSPYCDGYMSEVHFVDGIQKEPTDFGKTNADGVWVPIEYTGAYGTNGFYLDFANSSDFGSDQSGNANDFTDSGLATNDQVPDSPTNNYPTLNSAQEVWGSGAQTLSNGNLSGVGQAGGQSCNNAAAWTVNSGKWIYAVIPGGNSYNQGYPFICNETGRLARNSDLRGPANYWNCTQAVADLTSSQMYITKNTVAGTYNLSAAFVPGTDYVLVAVDVDNSNMWFGWYDVSTATTRWFDGTSGETGNPAAGTNPTGALAGSNFSFGIACVITGGGGSIDFGQGAVVDWSLVTIPTGFKFLNSQNLPEPTIKDGSAYFQTTLYTGNGTAIGSGGNAISQSGNSTFQPDLVWIKKRSGATEHVLTDAVRGVTKELSSNDFNAEETVAEGLTTFGSAGFTVGSDGSYNTSSATYVGWQWKANGAGSSNEDGSVSSTVSVNTTAGFSIAKAAASGSGVTFSIGHGLGIAPSVVICKGVGESLWSVYHHKISSPNDNYVRLDTTTAVVSESGIWGTGPTSSVFSAKSGAAMSHSADFVAYCFAEVDGFSKMGKYTGNGSTNGPMVNCGFRPAFVMTKRTNSTSNWAMWDTARDTFNVANKDLVADATNAEPVNSISIDILSNGFKLRTTSNPNASGGTYIYMAFAEHPFGGANTAPATAR
jgi:hypothetical protein